MSIDKAEKAPDVQVATAKPSLSSGAERCDIAILGLRHGICAPKNSVHKNNNDRHNILQQIRVEVNASYD